jgi:hypothetical protein
VLREIVFDTLPSAQDHSADRRIFAAPESWCFAEVDLIVRDALEEAPVSDRQQLRSDETFISRWRSLGSMTERIFSKTS